MNQISISRRRFVGGSLLAVGTAGLPACGGGDGDGAGKPATDAGTAEGRAYAATAGKTSADGSQTTAVPVVGSAITTLKVQATSTGVFPYAATVLPLPGQVPSGYTVRSNTDTTLRATVLSRWADGSAAVIIAAGSATLTTELTAAIPLQLASATTSAMRSSRNDGALTAARIVQVVNAVRVDFGSALGVASITNLSAPERIWWANAQTICARYRAGITGHPGLEAVVDIHAFASSSRALVEIVVENCKFAAASSTTASAPAAASYTATVTVNGTQVTAVNSSGGPEGNHAALRAWYASYWVGGDPGLRVTQLHTDLQQHPLFWKMARSSTADLSGYANDTYVPWGAGRHRGVNMGGTGDHPSIGFLTLWDSQFLQTGDARAARASEANALAILGYNVNYRDTASGLVPDANVLKRKSQTGFSKNWPRTTNAQDRMCWEVAHHPAAGLMAFVCRPSPVFIEIAQKICVWNATYGGDSSGMQGWPGTWPDTDFTGIFSSGYQIRGRAWSVRSLNHALFLSPDGSAWRDGAKYWLDRARLYLQGWQNHPQAILNVMWDDAPNDPTDHQPSQGGFQSPVWEYHWLICELHRSASAQFLSGTQQAALVSLADWCALQPVRWVNEQPNGAWRFLPYTTTIGGTTPINSLPTWGQQIAAWRNNAPPSVNGDWMTSYTYAEPATWTDYQADTAGAGYTMQFYAALVAAVERNVAGAGQAWATVGAGITTPGWQDRFGVDPRWGSAPKSAPSVAWSPAPSAGGYDPATFTWTPARDGNGIVTAASWALTPVGTFFQVASTKLDERVLPQVMAAVPTFRDFGTEGWAAVINSWNGMAVDDRLGTERAFFLASGGHAASSNNGGYAFDLRKMDWTVVRMPTAPTNWSTAYRGNASGSFTYNVDAAALYTANPTGGYYYDETTGERDPTARHTYATLAFAPNVGAKGMILFGCRRQWAYDVASNRYSPPRGMAGAADPATTEQGENGHGWWDEVRKRYYYYGGQGGTTCAYWYDPGTDTFGTDAPAPFGGYQAAYSCHEKIGRKVWALGYGDSINQHGRPILMASVNLDTGERTSNNINLGATFADKTFARDWWSDMGMTYVEPVGKWLCVVRTIQTGDVFAWIDPTTWVCEIASIAGLSSGIFRMCNRLKYLPTLRAVLWVHAIRSDLAEPIKNVRLLRFA